MHVLPISFKIRTSILFKLVEPHLACNYFSPNSNQICLKHKRRAFMAFEMERSLEKLQLIKLKEKKPTAIPSLPPPPHFYVFRVNHSST